MHIVRSWRNWSLGKCKLTPSQTQLSYWNRLDYVISVLFKDQDFVVKTQKIVAISLGFNMKNGPFVTLVYLDNMSWTSASQRF